MKKFALALFPFKDDLSKDLMGTLKKIKSMGYEGVEFAGGFYYKPSVLRAALEAVGLEIVGWHIDKYYICNELFESTVSYMNIIGNKILIVPDLQDEYTNSNEAWRNTAYEFNDLGKKLSDYGIKLGYHNHQKEFKRTDTGYIFDSFCENTNVDIIIQLDIGNMLSAGASPEDFIRKYPNRFSTVHIKPYSLLTGFNTMIGQDSIDYKSIINYCNTISGTEWFIIEYEHTNIFNNYEGAKLCLENFTDIYKEVMRI